MEEKRKHGIFNFFSADLCPCLSVLLFYCKSETCWVTKGLRQSVFWAQWSISGRLLCLLSATHGGADRACLVHPIIICHHDCGQPHFWLRVLARAALCVCVLVGGLSVWINERDTYRRCCLMHVSLIVSWLLQCLKEKCPFVLQFTLIGYLRRDLSFFQAPKLLSCWFLTSILWLKWLQSPSSH